MCLAPLMVFLAISMALSGHGPARTAAEPDLLDRLRALPGAIVKEIQAPASFDRAFEIWLLQPADHDDSGAGQFRQRMFLAHRDPAGVTVLETEGYATIRWTPAADGLPAVRGGTDP